MLITPEYISDLVNFYSNSLDPKWRFDPKAEDMRNLQVKGAAKAFNLLEKYKVALLADEVGMGKTIQSLAVCSALWNQKPNAKILIIAPRDEVATNWEKEYQTFISHHYRVSDNIVKGVIGNEPIKQMVYCQNLYSLVHQIKQKWAQLFIGKISSFSSLMAGNKALERLSSLKIRSLAKVEHLNSNPNLELNNEIMRLLRSEINEYSINEQPYFDLVIIDEAHYLRNKNSDSLRVNSAKIFFGDPSLPYATPISKRVLLLTATPNHSSSKDIKNIVSYFTSRFNDSEYKDVLDKICIRRLRRLSSKALNKYNYRYEKAPQSDFKENPLSEMFFGLYQHELAKEANKNKKGKGISGMMKYLEGVEFLPSENQSEDGGAEDDENKGNSADYKKGADTQMIVGLSKRYSSIFNTNPSHPKYEKLVEDLTQSHNCEKAVVFVRRIPSVQEIARRVIEFYDKRFWKIIQKGTLMNLEYENLDRKTFNKFVEELSIEEADDSSEGADEETKNIPASKVLNLFKVIKTEKPASTSASNFRLRFTRSKPGIFTLFFSPGENYFDAPYTNLKSYRFLVGTKDLENYYNSALLHRTKKIQEEEEAVSKNLLSRLLNKTPVKEQYETKTETFPTLLTIFWDVLISDDSVSKEEKDELINIYCNDFSYAESEAFSNYLEKATLLASESIIIFFQEFRNIQSSQTEKPIEQYLKFCQQIRNNLLSMRLYDQIKDSIRHFKVMYTKVFNLNNERQLLDESWDSFNNALPIYPYSADNSNKKVLRCFNTPFFPDILVATSVLQEGVNLQYFCNNVFHYGMAWTPGDNEQRIGRIDRMFGKIERLLEEKDGSTLNINYPYLKDTIDEEHLGRFVKRKFREEALIDLGKAFEEGSDYALEENEIGGWRRFLRTPDGQNISDPFPVTNIDFERIVCRRTGNKVINIDHYYFAIIHAIEEMDKFKSVSYFLNKNENKVILIDPTLNYERKQPVLIELVIDHIGSSWENSLVYIITMKTPLAPSSQFKFLKSRFYNSEAIQNTYGPGVKLCLDVSQTGGSHWGLYLKSELPLFSKELNQNPISIEEIQVSFRHLIMDADYIEKEIFNKDLTKEDLSIDLKKSDKINGFKFKRASSKYLDMSWKEQYDSIVKSILLVDFNGVDAEKKSLIINHQSNYIKLIKENKEWFAQVSLPSVDPNREEIQLLQRHLDVFIKGRDWDLNS